jgi:integration host factor subunit alpha
MLDRIGSFIHYNLVLAKALAEERRAVALTKEKLISRLQTQVGLSKQESRAAVERVLDIMKETLSRSEDLLISGFGKFSVKQKNARRGRNPQTKENLILRARKVVVFKTSGVLRNLINGTRSI